MAIHSSSLNELHEKLYLDGVGNDKEQDWVALSSMLHFYENIADLVERGLIDREAAAVNFKKYFRWLRDHPTFAAALKLSRERGETWFFISRFEFLEAKAGF